MSNPTNYFGWMCCGDSVTHKVQIPIYGCFGPFDMTVGEVSITGPTGGAITPIKVSASVFQFTVTVAGTYTITATVPGYWPQTVTRAVVLIGSTLVLAPIYLASKTFTATIVPECFERTGKTVTISGGVYGDTEVTDSTGVIVFNLPDPGAIPPNFTITVSAPRYQTTIVSYTSPGSNYSMICADAIHLPASDCYVCCNGTCGYPVTPTFLLTTPGGKTVSFGLTGFGTFTVFGEGKPPDTDFIDIHHPGANSCDPTVATVMMDYPFVVSWECPSGFPPYHLTPAGSPQLAFQWAVCFLKAGGDIRLGCQGDITSFAYGGPTATGIYRSSPFLACVTVACDSICTPDGFSATATVAGTAYIDGVYTIAEIPCY